MTISLSGPRSRFAPHLAALSALLALQSCGGGGDLSCGGPFCVVPPGAEQATRLEPVAGDSQTGAPGRELLIPIEVLVTDDDGRLIPDVEVSFAVGQPGGALSDTTIRSDYQGLAKVRWTLGAVPGAQTIEAIATGGSGVPLSGSPLTFSAQAVAPPPARLVLRQPPSGRVRNGMLFPSQPVVEVLDAEDEPVAQVEVTAGIAVGGGALSGTATVPTDAAGRASFADLAIEGAAGPRTLRFSVADPALEIVSGTVEVGAGSSFRLVASEPLVYEGTVNSPVSPAPSVTVFDAAGNPVPGAAITFTADQDGSVSPTTAITNELGVAQAGWTLGRSANLQYSLSAQIQSGGDPVVFSAIASAGAAGRLAVRTQPPTTARSGDAFGRQPVIQVVDQLGNPASQPGVRITATLSSGPAGTLANASATTNASGLATFSGLALTGLVGEYRVSFSAPSLEGVGSERILLAAGAPARLSLVRQLAPAARSRVPLSTQPEIQVEDASGNPIREAGIPVAAAVASGGGSLGGGTTVATDASGRAGFTDLAIIGAPGSRTLRFTGAGSSSGAVSSEITLPGVATISVLTAPPPSVVVGTRLDNPVSWSLKDAASQPVADAPVTVSVSPGGAVEPSTGVSDVDGIVQLQSWDVAPLASTQSVALEAADAGGSRVEIEAVPDVAFQLLKISGDNQSAEVNSDLPAPLVVRVVDQFQNGVSGATVQWRTCDGVGDYDPVTDVGGYASAFQATGAEPGTFCIMASSGELLDSPIQFSFTATAATDGSVPPPLNGQLQGATPAPALGRTHTRR
ncbi:MAG: Ig-like domain-containing protein [Gemmatimonadales bacterium]|nr:Ig-like domain-containing protein [Gemmatimonadales bacterium]